MRRVSGARRTASGKSTINFANRMILRKIVWMFFVSPDDFGLEHDGLRGEGRLDSMFYVFAVAFSPQSNFGRGTMNGSSACADLL